jgi:hypothetical protein
MKRAFLFMEQKLPFVLRTFFWQSIFQSLIRKKQGERIGETQCPLFLIKKNKYHVCLVLLKYLYHSPQYLNVV